MAVDWQLGDLAVCVDASPHRMPECRGVAWPMKEGSVWRVSEVLLMRRGTIALRFHNQPQLYPGKLGYHPARFRKIRPDAHEGSAEDWNLLLETTKRTKVSA